MSKIKKYILYSVVVVLIAGAAYYFFGSTKEEVYNWKTVKSEKGTINVNVTATGIVEALTTVQVGTQVSGTISKIYVDYNSYVKEGQVIAEIDKTYLYASVQDAEAAADRARVMADQAKREYNRAKTLFDQKVIAQSEFDKLQADYETAESNYKSAVAKLHRERINLQFATIKAPISGVIISRSVDVGQTVAASFNTPTLFSIAKDLTSMQLKADVDEADIGLVKEGQKVIFSVDAYPDLKFEGRVKQIRLQPNVVQNVVTYSVIMEVSNPDKKLLPGMTASITVIIKEKDNVVKIPLGAAKFSPSRGFIRSTLKNSNDSIRKIFKSTLPGKLVGSEEEAKEARKDRFNEGDTVLIWVKKGAMIYPRKVIAGLSDNSNLEVSGDIRQGEEVVTGVITESVAGQGTKNPFVPQMGGGRRRM